MTTISTKAAGEDLDALVSKVARSKKTVKLRDGLGCFIYLVSREELDGLKATAELSAIPGMKESLIKSRATPVEECLPEEEFDWNAL